MRAQPREYDRALHGGEMRPLFTLLYPLKSVRWFEPDSNQPVVFYINPDAAPNPQVIDDVGAAMNAWTNLAGCKLRVVNAVLYENVRERLSIVTVRCETCALEDMRHF